MSDEFNPFINPEQSIGQRVDDPLDPASPFYDPQMAARSAGAKLPEVGEDEVWVDVRLPRELGKYEGMDLDAHLIRRGIPSRQRWIKPRSLRERFAGPKSIPQVPERFAEDAAREAAAFLAEPALADGRLP
jgi:hypothetical protein